jgi:hypothetical protein
MSFSHPSPRRGFPASSLHDGCLRAGEVIRLVSNAYEPQIRALLKDCNTMPRRSSQSGSDGRGASPSSKSASLRSARRFLEPDPFQRTDYRPGELGQWDIWLPAADIPGRLRPHRPVTGDRRCYRLFAHHRSHDSVA